MVMATAGVSRLHETRNDRNVGDRERIASVLGGALLAGYGLERRDLPGLGLVALGAMLVQRGASGHCMVYGALGVSTREGSIPRRKRGEIVSAAATVNARDAIKVEQTITVERPPAELYGVWRDFRNLPRFMRDLESVTSLADGRTHWVAVGPGGTRIEWDAVIVNDIQDSLIAWKTVGSPDIAHAGSVHFRPSADGRGTDVRLIMEYEPPGGRLGKVASALTRIFGESPSQRMKEDLERFKEQMESGAATI